MQGMIRGNAAMSQDAGSKFAEPMPPIPCAVDRLTMQVSSLDADLTELHNRLHRVLRDAPQAPGQTAGSAINAAPPISSQTYQQVEMQTARLEQMSRYVRDILDRLEA